MKCVHDVTASECDFLRLCERLGTERSMSTEMTEDAKLEVALRLSLYRNGFAYGVKEATSLVLFSQRQEHKHCLNDADYAAGYSAGSVVAEQAIQGYHAALEGR